MKKMVTEQYGKTVEEAIRKGLEELKVPRDDAKITIIDEPTKGILGMLSSKLAKVKIEYEKKVDEDTVNRTEERAKEILERIFKITNDESKYEISREGQEIFIKIDCGQSAHLIGYKGKTIEALQSTINSILQQEEQDTTRVFIEVNDYKKKREEQVKQLANRLAKNVAKYKKSIKMAPMKSYERMIVHTELADDKFVYTESVGKEPARCVVIKLKRK